MRIEYSVNVAFVLIIMASLHDLSGAFQLNSFRLSVTSKITVQDRAVSVKPETSSLLKNPLHQRRLVLSVPFLFAACPAEKCHALVKGSSPPPKKSSSYSRKCKTIDECEEIGREKEEALFDTAQDDLAAVQKTSSGDEYRDLSVGAGSEVKVGSEVQLKYRVLRLGKRSSDGLSGEASPVFSRGYGEDDDKITDFDTITIGQGNVIAALDEGIRGMRAGGRRRVNVRPERGWKLPDNICLKTYTDVTIVPTTKVQENDACFATGLYPTPSNYGAKRRMLRRYDETLIVDCEVVSVR